MPVSHPMKTALVLALLSSLPASAALASEPAMISKVGGKNVSWQSGETTAAPRVQSLLAAGDRLVVGKGSFVDVEYLGDNCTVRIKAGGSITIGDTSPCAAKQAAATAAVDAARVVPAAAAAVEVTGKTGPVTRADLGAGLVDLSVGDSLKMGDEVFAGPDSSVTLYFAVPGCSYTVTGGNLYKVSSEPPCKAAAGMEGGASASASSVSPGVVVGAVAGAAVIGGVALIALSGDDNGGNNNPVTPD